MNSAARRLLADFARRRFGARRGDRSLRVVVTALVFGAAFIGLGSGSGSGSGAFTPRSACAAVLEVGPGKTYAMPCQAIAAAQPGDTINVEASGHYDGDTCAWQTDKLTVRGVNGRAKIDLKGVAPAQRKGIFTIAADNATVENFELSGAAISANDGNNGAGIRHQGLNLTVTNCFFHDNQNGILGGPSVAGQGTVVISRSEFANNGAGDGYSHNMYIGNYAAFTLQSSYSHNAKVGHLVKSRAHVNQILYNRITDETGGTASYEIDLPNGGRSYIIGNLIEQSATTQNPAIVTFAEEGLPAGYDEHLYLVNNTLLNDRKSGTFVVDKALTPAVLTNNCFWNGGTISSQGNAVMTANFDSGVGDPMFVDVARFDVHLRAGSPLIDKGQLPGVGSGMALAPAFEYRQPEDQIARALVGGAIDVGAYEFGNSGDAADAGAPPDAEVPRDAGRALEDFYRNGNPLDFPLSESDATGGTKSSSGCSVHRGRVGSSGAAPAWATMLVLALFISRRRR